MSVDRTKHAADFRELHGPGRLLVLPNAWDAASARVVEECGAQAIATSSAAVAWAHGWADGNQLPPRAMLAAVAEMARVVRVPLTSDIEGGYSDDPARVADLVAAVAGEGAVGVNIEDGAGSIDLLCAKIEAAKAGAARARVDVFVNARTDVYLRALVAPERALAETLERVARLRAAGCDGVFVPFLALDGVAAVVEACGPVPLNLLAAPGLPPAAHLRELGVRRLSAGSALASMALATVRRLASGFLGDGRSEPLAEGGVAYGEMNGLLASR